MEKINIKLKDFIKEVIILIRKPVMSILPGQLSFFLLLSIIPIILIVGLVSSALSFDSSSLIDIIKNSLPVNTSSLIIPLLSGRGFDYNIIALLISTILLISKGTGSMINVSNIIYGTHKKNTIKTYIKSFALAIILIFLFVFMIIIPILGGRILKILHKFEVISVLTDNIIYLFNILKWPISIFIIYINIKIVYILLPNKKITAKSVNKGSLFTTLLWILSTLFYSFYITHLTKYNLFYGGASNIIVLMLWIYLISYIFVLGIGINASNLKVDSLYNQDKKK